MTKIFQYSIDTGTLPQIWKLENVVPIYKAGDMSLPCNYRPVSLTSKVCKMLEHIVLHYLNKYLDKILCTNQHDFRKGMSCGTQLITVFHQIFQLRDNGLPVQITAFDFAKAFDKVPHQLLVEKLHSFNISVQIIEWIKNFLTARKQQVILNDATSDGQVYHRVMFWDRHSFFFISGILLKISAPV